MPGVADSVGRWKRWRRIVSRVCGGVRSSARPAGWSAGSAPGLPAPFGARPVADERRSATVQWVGNRGVWRGAGGRVADRVARTVASTGAGSAATMRAPLRRACGGSSATRTASTCAGLSKAAWPRTLTTPSVSRWAQAPQCAASSRRHQAG